MTRDTTTRRYRLITIDAGRGQTITAADPLPDDLQQALTKLRQDGPATALI